MKSVLVISPSDNVATALAALQPGVTVDVEGTRVVVRDPIPAGHKLALTIIPAGSPVIKYGSPIGVASTDIAPGVHVHTHNVASTRGRGDAPVSTDHLRAGAMRLAEPPDPRVEDSTPAEEGDSEAHRE